MLSRAVTNRTAPKPFVEALNRLKGRLVKIAVDFFPDAVARNLSKSGIIVEETGFTNDVVNVVHYRVTGVTDKPDRDFDGFKNAIAKEIDLLAEMHWSDASLSVFVVIELSPEKMLREYEADIAVVDTP